MHTIQDDGPIHLGGPTPGRLRLKPGVLAPWIFKMASSILSCSNGGGKQDINVALIAPGPCRLYGEELWRSVVEM
jgi:hypothetical protein